MTFLTKNGFYQKLLMEKTFNAYILNQDNKTDQNQSKKVGVRFHPNLVKIAKSGFFYTFYRRFNKNYPYIYMRGKKKINRKNDC